MPVSHSAFYVISVWSVPARRLNREAKNGGAVRRGGGCSCRAAGVGGRKVLPRRKKKKGVGEEKAKGGMEVAEEKESVERQRVKEG